MIQGSYIINLIETSLGEFRQMGGPGSGHHGHKGRKGKRGGSARSRAGGVAVSKPEFVRHVIGGGTGKSRKRVVIKGEYEGKTVMGAANLEDEKYLATPDEMHEYVSKSVLFADSAVGTVTFVPQDEHEGKRFGGSYWEGSARVATRDISAYKKYPRNPETIVRTLDHELAHHFDWGEKAVDLGRLESIATAERGAFPGLGDKAHVKSMWGTNRRMAVGEYFAGATVQYFYNRAELAESCPETLAYMEEFHGK